MRAAWQEIQAITTSAGISPNADLIRQSIKTRSRRDQAEPAESYAARLARVDDDMAKRVREGKASLEYAESVMAERAARLDAWVARVREALLVLGRMAGYPVPPELSKRLAVNERAELDVVLEALAEAFGYGHRDQGTVRPVHRNGGDDANADDLTPSDACELPTPTSGSSP